MKSHCLIEIENALFRIQNSHWGKHSYVFPNRIKRFEISRPNKGGAFWGIMGAQKSAFLNILASKYIADPPTSRRYPSINDFLRSDQIGYLNFRDSSGLDKVHMSARYESYSYIGALEMSEDCNSVRRYVTGANNYNQLVEISDEAFIEKILKLFDLTGLESKWISSLSNGQMRRARIAKAVMNMPKLLLIDDPFLGLDPTSTISVSSSLKDVAQEFNISIVLGLRIQDDLPDWLSHLVYVSKAGLEISGDRDQVEREIMVALGAAMIKHKAYENLYKRTKLMKKKEIVVADPIIEFNNASVVYKGQCVLQNFNWKVERGSKWRILGNNGTGKTTILSLITADHPQSWRSVMAVNGVTRKPGCGVTYFEINDMIGISSPELHAVVPPLMSMKLIILNGLVPGIGNSNFLFQFKSNTVDTYAEKILAYFNDELRTNETKRFNELSVSLQKLALFLRAVLKKPDILILDEAFSCMDDEDLVIKCHKFIKDELQKTTIFTIGHIDWEVSESDHVLKLLGDANRGYEFYTQSAQ